MENQSGRTKWDAMAEMYDKHPYISWFLGASIVSTIAAIPAGIINAIRKPKDAYLTADQIRAKNGSIVTPICKDVTVTEEEKEETEE